MRREALFLEMTVGSALPVVLPAWKQLATPINGTEWLECCVPAMALRISPSAFEHACQSGLLGVVLSAFVFLSPPGSGSTMGVRANKASALVRLSRRPVHPASTYREALSRFLFSTNRDHRLGCLAVGTVAKPHRPQRSRRDVPPVEPVWRGDRDRFTRIGQGSWKVRGPAVVPAPPHSTRPSSRLTARVAAAPRPVSAVANRRPWCWAARAATAPDSARSRWCCASWALANSASVLNDYLTNPE